MKAKKKYQDGGELPLNKRRLLSIKRRAEEAFDSGDIEKAKKLAAKADKIGKRQEKWSKKIAAYVAEQDRRASKGGRSISTAEIIASDLMARQNYGSSASNLPDSNRKTTPPKPPTKPPTSKSKGSK